MPIRDGRRVEVGGDQVGGNCWRTTGDITDTWEASIRGGKFGFKQAGQNEKFAKPGNWNDPDMLVVGKVGWGPAELHQTHLSPNEQYTHVRLWSCSPSRC